MKIIVSNKARSHMEAHKKEFFANWKKLIKEVEKTEKVRNLTNDFEIIESEFHNPIGYCNLVEVKKEDKVIYARRLGRDIYTKFVMDREPKLTNKLTIILKRSNQNSDEYYLISMFAGTKNYKEPEDINIANKQELEESLRFWSSHALIYSEETIEKESIKTYCPYKNLYLAIA